MYRAPSNYDPWEYNLGRLEERFDYLSIVIENDSVIDYVSTCGYMGVSHMSGFGKIFSRLEKDGWFKYDETEQYSSLGPRYRVFLMREKVK